MSSCPEQDNILFYMDSLFATRRRVLYNRQGFNLQQHILDQLTRRLLPQGL
jgi:hypothetical protein